MNEWFKARLIWAEALNALSDAEAGRFCKALWAYAAHGETAQLSGAERVAFAMAQQQLRVDNEERERISNERKLAGSKGGKSKQLQANATVCLANQAIATNKNKNKEKDIYASAKADANTHTRKRFVPPTVEEVREYCLSKGYGVDAELFVLFYESKGWMIGRNPMKNWHAAIATWVKNSPSPFPSQPQLPGQMSVDDCNLPRW